LCGEIEKFTSSGTYDLLLSMGQESFSLNTDKVGEKLTRLERVTSLLATKYIKADETDTSGTKFLDGVSRSLTLQANIWLGLSDEAKLEVKKFLSKNNTWGNIRPQLILTEYLEYEQNGGNLSQAQWETAQAEKALFSDSVA